MRKSLHILVLPSWYCTSWSPAGGIFFKEQALALEECGARVAVAYPQMAPFRPISRAVLQQYHYQMQWRVEDGLPTGRLFGWNFLPRMWPHFWTWAARYLVQHYIRRHGRPDIIHAQGTLWGGVAARRLALLHIPWVITEQSSAIHDNQLSPPELKEARRALRGASRVIACSSSLAQLLHERGLARHDQLRVVPYPVNTSYFTLPPERPPPQPFRLLMVGFLEQYKRVNLAIQAFAEAFPVEANVELEIGGDGSQRAVLEQQALALGIANRVKFLGSLSREQVRDAMRRAHALVLPSPYETFGVVLVEALASGLPVIATSRGGPADSITPEVGIHIPTDDAATLAAALRRMRHEYRNYNPAVLRDRALALFSNRVVAERLLSVFEEVRGQQKAKTNLEIVTRSA